MIKDIYISCKGREYGGIFEERGVQIIRALIVQEVGLPAGYTIDDITNKTSFDNLIATGGLRHDWLFAGQLNRKIRSDKLLDEIAKQMCCNLILDENNSLKIIPIEPVSTEKVITINDIRKFNKEESQITITKTKRDYVFNDFLIYYKYDYMPEKYAKNEYINKDGSSLTAAENVRTGIIETYTDTCLASYNKYGQTRKYEFYGHYISDRDTAIKVLKWLCDFFTRKRYVIEIKCVLNPNTVEFEIGDCTRVDLTLLEIETRDKSKFMITEIETDYFRDTIDIKLLEITYPI